MASCKAQMHLQRATTFAWTNRKMQKYLKKIGILKNVYFIALCQPVEYQGKDNKIDAN